MTKQGHFPKRFVTASLLMTGIMVLVAACSSDPAPAPPPPTPVPEVGSLGAVSTDAPAVTSARFGEVGSVAQELQGISGWINTEPFTLESLRGQVVLIDFWTYTCVNCIRTIPFLREWHEKYADEGLVIVGVHSPEFEFEEVRENVEAAMEKFEIGWRVAQDNDFRTWRAYNNRFWPAKYLIDKDGIIRYTHFGEGAYDETELEIRKLLQDAGASLDGIVANPDPGPVVDERARSGGFATGQTRELYAGLDRNFNSQTPYILQVEVYGSPAGTPILLEDPGNHQNHFLYLHGMWTNDRESAIHSRVTENLEDYVALRYFGTSVNVVLGIELGEPYRVYLTVDDAPIPSVDRGADIQEDEDGRTFILVDEDRLYRLIESPEYSSHEMKLSSNSDEFAVFAFTFGSYDVGP